MVQTVQYDALGNITNKSDVGAYIYSKVKAGAHAVTSAGTNTYEYDANGNMTFDRVSGLAKRTMTYTAADQVATIVQNNQSEAFYYGTDRSRYKRVDSNPGGDTTTLYVGSVEKIKARGNTGVLKWKEWKRSIAGVGQITLRLQFVDVPWL